MQKLHKILMFSLCAAVLFGLSACGKDEDDSQPPATSEPVATSEPMITSAPEGTEAPEISEAPVEPDAPDAAAPAGTSGAEATPAVSGEPQAVFGFVGNEQDIHDALEADITVVGDEDYGDTLSKLTSGDTSRIGFLYELEGVFKTSNGTPYVVRTMVNGDERIELGLPLIDLQKAVSEGAWIRVMGILNEGEVNGAKTAVLQVLTIEGLAEAGQAELTWSGPASQ